MNPDIRRHKKIIKKLLIGQILFMLLLYYKLAIRIFSFEKLIRNSSIGEGTEFNHENSKNNRRIFVIKESIDKTTLQYKFLGFKCYEKALTVKTVLSLLNIGCTVHFGIKKNNRNIIEAHAWCVSEGIVVTGYESMKEFTQVYCAKFK